MRPLRRLICSLLLVLALPLQALAAVSALPCAHHQGQPSAATDHAPCHEAAADTAATGGDAVDAGQAQACSACAACGTAPALPATPVALAPLAAAGDIAPELRATPTALAPERLERPPRDRLA